jgi:hypothetical protein
VIFVVPLAAAPQRPSAHAAAASESVAFRLDAAGQPKRAALGVPLAPTRSPEFAAALDASQHPADRLRSPFMTTLSVHDFVALSRTQRPPTQPPGELMSPRRQ